MRIAIASVILILVWASAFAQQQPSPIDQAIKSQLGDLIFNNTIMATEIKRLMEENTKMKAELATLRKEKEDAKQKP